MCIVFFFYEEKRELETNPIVGYLSNSDFFLV